MEPTSYLPGKLITFRKYTTSSLSIVKKSMSLFCISQNRELNKSLEYHSQKAPIFLLVDVWICLSGKLLGRISWSSQRQFSLFTFLISQRYSASANELFIASYGGLR